MKHEIKYKHAAALRECVMSSAIGFCHSLLDNHVIFEQCLFFFVRCGGDIKVAQYL